MSRCRLLDCGSGVEVASGFVPSVEEAPIVSVGTDSFAIGFAGKVENWAVLDGSVAWWPAAQFAGATGGGGGPGAGDGGGLAPFGAVRRLS